MGILLLFSVFRYISYPLLWNDEAETAEYGRRILKYGYPKIHDGDKLLFLWEQGPISLGTKEPLDAYIISGWGQYYFAAIPAFFTHYTENIYFPTAIMRIPFAAVGCLGLAIMLLAIAQCFSSTNERLNISAIFLILCLSSISLALHLREVRYYSLILFFSSCSFWIFSKRVIVQQSGYKTYLVLLPIFLLGILVSFYPVFIIMILSMGIYVCASHLMQRNNWRENLHFLCKEALPLFLSAALAIPYFIFFETFSISAAISRYWNFDSNLYGRNFLKFLHFFWAYEWLGMAIALKLFFYLVKLRHVIPNEFTQRKIRFSNFLSLYFAIYLILISRSPQYFERYAFSLIPVLFAVMLLDLYAALEIIQFSNKRPALRQWSIALFTTGAVLLAFRQKDHYIGHLQELRHPYRGPLDFAITFLEDKYPDTADLVIATNYEEPAYMFYLDARVIYGFAMKEIEKDLTLIPDVVIYRRAWGDPRLYQQLLQQHEYQPNILPVADHPVNNLPELSFSIPHLYRTPLAKNPYDRLVIFTRKTAASH